MRHRPRGEAVEATANLDDGQLETPERTLGRRAGGGRPRGEDGAGPEQASSDRKCAQDPVHRNDCAAGA